MLTRLMGEHAEEFLQAIRESDLDDVEHDATDAGQHAAAESVHDWYDGKTATGDDDLFGQQHEPTESGTSKCASSGIDSAEPGAIISSRKLWRSELSHILRL